MQVSTLLHPGQLIRQVLPKDPQATLENIVGTSVDELTLKGLVKNTPLSAVSGLPIEAVSEVQDYRTHKLKANQYLATVTTNSLGWAAWGLGSALAGGAMMALGAPGILVGAAAMGAGLLCGTIWSRTGGAALLKPLARLIPEKVARPIANVFAAVTGPVIDHVIKPLGNFWNHHKVLCIGLGAGLLAGLGGLLAWRFPAVGAKLAKAVLTVGAKAGIGTVAATAVTKLAIDRVLPEKKDAFKK
jgi:hypothetical protein